MAPDGRFVAGDVDAFRTIQVSDTADFDGLHSATPIAFPSQRQTFFVMTAMVVHAPIHL